MNQPTNLNDETNALFDRIQYIRQILVDAEEDGGEIYGGEEDVGGDEYQQFILSYIEQIKSQIEENHEEFEQLFRIKSILEQNIEKLSDSLNVARKQIERQNIKLSSMSKARSDMENREREMELTVRDYQSQLREMKKTTQELESRITEVTQKNSSLAQEVSELTTDNALLHQGKDNMEKDYFNLNEKLLGVEQALEAKTDEFDRISSRIQSVEMQVVSNESSADDLLQENIDLGQGILEMEKSLTYMREAMFKFMDFIRPDLPAKSLYKILFCLIENKRVKVREFKTLTNITTKTSYSDIKELEKLGLVYIDRQNAKSYVDYVVSLALGEE